MLPRILRASTSLSSLRHIIRKNFLVLLLTLALPASAATAQNDRDTPTLELGKVIEREFAGGQSHSYLITLTSGQYVHVVIDQRGIDVVATLTGPDGKQILEVDSPNGTQGPESVFYMAESGGRYRLEVHPLNKDVYGGRYEVRIDDLRAATAQDRKRLAAEQALSAGNRLKAQGTIDSLTRSIEKYKEALDGSRGIRDRRGEQLALQNIGFAYYLLDERQKALGFLSEALTLAQTMGDRSGESHILNNIGLIHYESGENQQALNFYSRALELIRALNDRGGEAAILTNMGFIYHVIGERQIALEFYNNALSLMRSTGNRSGEAKVLGSIGSIHRVMGETEMALDLFNQALSLSRAVGDRRSEAAALNNIGHVYNFTGETQKALDFYRQVLLLRRATEDRSGEAATLTNIGSTYQSLGETQKALSNFLQALPIMRTVGNHSGEADTLKGIGRVYDALGERQQSIGYYGQALSLYRAVGDRESEAGTLNDIGVSYYISGEGQKALDYHGQALLLFQAAGYRDGEASAFNNLMSDYASLNNPRAAIFYGKQAVDVKQQLRSNIQGLDKNIQKTFLRTVEHTYRDLAGLLIEQGRSAEAQQVLNAFKDQQVFDFHRAQDGQLNQLTHTPREANFAARVKRASNSFREISGRLEELKGRLRNRQPTDEEATLLQKLKAGLTATSLEFSAQLQLAETEFSKPIDEKDAAGEVPDIVQMQAMLRQLGQETGQKTVAVYTLVGDIKFYALIITEDDIISVAAHIKGAELNNKARQLWALLKSADYDPRPLSNELYNAVIKPIKDRLPINTNTIMWSLDGNLRYFPMAALYDGKQYLVEQYNHVVFTRVDKERLTRAINDDWTGYGFASSAAHTVQVAGEQIAFGRLEAVAGEMQIFRNDLSPTGIIDGEVLTETQFNKASLLSSLKRPRSLVHISSHFRFRPGDETQSFLLLGDGQVMTLAEMKEYPNLFRGVELLTLSACDTAAQRPDATGREVDAFAELAQRLGTDGVMASLWAVRDRSTARLMKEFYRYRQGGKYTKAEALRKAQLNLLYGNTEELQTSTKQGGAITRRDGLADEEIMVDARYRTPFKVDRGKPFAHPHYWSPFVLFGNWK